MNETDDTIFSDLEEILLQIIDLYYISRYSDKKEDILKHVKKVFMTIEESSLLEAEKVYLLAEIIDCLLKNKNIQRREILQQISDTKKLIQVNILMLAKRIEPIVQNLSLYAEDYLYCYAEKNPLRLSDLVDQLKSLREEFTIHVSYEDFKKLYIEILKKQETINEKLSNAWKNLWPRFEQLALSLVIKEITLILPYICRGYYLHRHYENISPREMQFFEIIFYLLRFPHNKAKVIELIKSLNNSYSKFILGTILLRLDSNIYNSIRDIILESSIQILNDLLSDDKKLPGKYDLVRLSCLYKELPFDLKQIIYEKINPHFKRILAEYLSKQILSSDLEVFIRTYDLFEDFLVMLGKTLDETLDEFSLMRKIDYALSIIMGNMTYISRESIRRFFKKLFEIHLEIATKYLYDIKYIDPELYEELLDFVWNKLLELKEANIKSFFKILFNVYEPLSEKYRGIKRLLDEVPLIIKRSLKNGIIHANYAIHVARAIKKYSEEYEREIINIVSAYIDEAKEKLTFQMLEKIIWTMPSSPAYNKLLLKALLLIGQLLSKEKINQSSIKRLCEIEFQIIRKIPQEILKEALQAFKPWVKRVVNFMIIDSQAFDKLKINEKTFLLPQELYQGPYGCLEQILFRYREINDREMTDFLEAIFRVLIAEIKPETSPRKILRTLILLRLFSEIIDGRHLCKILLERYIDFIAKNFGKPHKIYPHYIAIVLKDLIHDTSEITKYVLNLISNIDNKLARLVLFEILAYINREEMHRIPDK